LVEGERHPQHLDEAGARAILWGNSAETLMALGRLPESIGRYRQAEAASSPGSLEWELAEWGLGVAFDRDGQSEKSRSHVASALGVDPTLAHLDSDDVFFEPPGDKLYYQALGHEVAGDREEAVAAWRAFVDSSPGSPFVRRAREHLEDLRRLPPSPGIGRQRLRVTVGEALVLRTVRGAQTLRRAVEENLEGLRTCYGRAISGDPTHAPDGEALLRPARKRRAAQLPRGELRISLEVAPSGRVEQRPHVLIATIEVPGLARCVELAAASWRFPQVEAEETEELILSLDFDVAP
jgi:tetratricopeptide (TPR) repeat protein